MPVTEHCSVGCKSQEHCKRSTFSSIDPCNEKPVLFVMEGSIECSKALELLEKNNQDVEVVDVDKEPLMSYIERFVGIDFVPALMTTSFTVYCGYDGIDQQYLTKIKTYNEE